MYAWLRRCLLLSDCRTDAVLAASGGRLVLTVVPGARIAAQGITEASVAPSPGVSTRCRDDVNSRFYQWIFERRADTARATNSLEREILQALDELLHTVDVVDLVPRMPGVLPRLLRSIRGGDFSPAQLSQEIVQDVVLVAELMRLVNSSLYNPVTAINSIEHALLVLGQTGLRQLVTCMAFRPIIDVNSGHFVRLAAPRVWEQAEQCALANRWLAADHGSDPFQAFLAGLLQDVGLIICLRVMDQVAQGKRLLGSTQFLSSLLAYARRLSVRIAQAWHFPDSVSGAIEEQACDHATVSTLGETLRSGWEKMLMKSSGNCRMRRSPVTRCWAEGRTLRALRLAGILRRVNKAVPSDGHRQQVARAIDGLDESWAVWIVAQFASQARNAHVDTPVQR
jgi:HD-like signal output (HDOD) protein